MKINEIFYSIQGESTLIGKPVIFIRTSGCNVRCKYCDTEYAFEKGESILPVDIVGNIKKYPCKSVCITGGEPLVQTEQLLNLIKTLKHWRYYVSLETNGTIPITYGLKEVDKIVMDIKCPSSGIVINENVTELNVQALDLDKDEIKFVVSPSHCEPNDLRFVEKWLKKIPKDIKITISPVIKNEIHDGSDFYFAVSTSLRSLSEWVKDLDTGHDIRLLPQLHKIIWPDVKKGV